MTRAKPTPRDLRMTTLLAHTAHALITGAVGCVLAAVGVIGLYLRRSR